MLRHLLPANDAVDCRLLVRRQWPDFVGGQDAGYLVGQEVSAALAARSSRKRVTMAPGMV